MKWMVVNIVNVLVFSKEEIEKLVDLTKEPSYRLPSGLSREERRKWISDIGSKLLIQNSEEGIVE